MQIIVLLLLLSSSVPALCFDYFKLVLQWPNTVCKVDENSNCPQPIEQNFTIHGLWPQLKNRASLGNCSTKEVLTDAMLQNLKTELLKYWPNVFTNEWERTKTFWRYEWDKHGSCSAENFPPEKYLKTTIALSKTYDILGILKQKGIVPDDNKKYDPQTVHSVISSGINVKPTIECKSNKTDLHLFQVYLCVEKNGKDFKDCTYATKNCTTSSVIFATNPHKIFHEP